MGGGYSVQDIPSLEGKTAIITGASAGLGKVCATEMARKGCHIVMACRSQSKTLPVLEQIQKETGNEKVEFMELNLSSLASVQQFVEAYKEKGYPIHILLNNAAVMACPFGLSEDGLELQFATNHLGHFLLTIGLLDVIESSAPSRIVNISSMGHRFAPKEGIAFSKINDQTIYEPWTAYGQSKLANILFTNELAKRLKDKSVYCNSVHPGYVATELSRNVKDLYGSAADVLASISASLFAKNPLNGSLTSLYVATSPEIEEKGITGQYFVPTAKLSKTSTQGTDEELAAKLWEFSEKLIQEKLEGGAEDRPKDEGEAREKEEN